MLRCCDWLSEEEKNQVCVVIADFFGVGLNQNQNQKKPKKPKNQKNQKKIDFFF